MPSPALDLSQPFTVAQARAAGIDKNELRSPAFRSLHRGIYISSQVPMTPFLTARAAVLASGPGAIASHATAARHWRFPLPHLPGEHVTVTDRKARRTRSGLTCHHSTTPPPAMKYGDVLISRPEQVFVELASMLTLVDLVVVGDHLVRNADATLSALRQHCERATGPGAAAARRAADLVREHVDSPMETRLRLLIVLAGLPEPQVNLAQVINGASRRFDLCWPDAKVIVEYDGRHHIERKEQWEADLRRREAIEREGWRFLVFVARDIYTTPGETLERVTDALRERGTRGLPRALAPAWREHFGRQVAD